MTARTRWIIAIVGLLAANVIATVFLATTAGTPNVVPGYHELAPYSKGAASKSAP